MEQMRVYAVLPEPKKKNEIPFLAYCQLVCAVPRGMVVRESEIECCLHEVYGEDSVLEHTNQLANMKAGEFLPYWRIVSDRGHLIPLGIDDRDLQQRKLQEEGLKVLRPKPEQQEYVVADYMEHLFDFSNSRVHVILGEEFLKKQLESERKRLTEF